MSRARHRATRRGRVRLHERDFDGFLADTVLAPAGAAAIHGVRWFPSRPPVIGLEYEMDLRGVARELLV